MPINSVTKTIDGHSVVINQFYAAQGFKIKARFLKVFLPVISPMISGLDLSDPEKLANVKLGEMLPKAMVALSDTIDAEVLYRLFLDMLSSVFLDNKMIDEAVFNEAFIGKYTLLYKLIYEVVQANNFLDLGGIGGMLPPGISSIQNPPQE